MRTRILGFAVAVACALTVGHASLAQQPQTSTPPRPPVAPVAVNPIEPSCLKEADGEGRGAQPSPVVTVQAVDGKVHLVVSSRPRATVAVVTHETGAISFDRPVCLRGVEAIVTRPAD